jgi:hypothetical protein
MAVLATLIRNVKTVMGFPQVRVLARQLKWRSIAIFLYSQSNSFL